MNNNLVDYIDSPFSKIILKEDNVKKIISKVEKICKSNFRTTISKKANIELRTWDRVLKGQTIKCLTFDRLGKLCELNDYFMRESIKQIDGIIDPDLPLDFDCKEGVRLDVGVINEGRIRSRIVEYTNKDREVLEIIESSARKVVGKNFVPKIRLDKRDQTICMSFPALFAKHFLKIGIEGNKSKIQINVPDYIMNNEKYHKIWWQGNLSEESSIFPSIGINTNKKEFYITPKIQINRVKSVNVTINNLEKEKTYYHRDLPSNILIELKSNIMSLIKDEAKILSNLGIVNKPHFSKLYINKKYEKTATYSIEISSLKNLEIYYSEIGFELNRHKKQFELLFNNAGGKSKNEVRETFIKFYKLVPKYLRGIKKIKSNKFLIEEDKEELLGYENVKTGYSQLIR